MTKFLLAFFLAALPGLGTGLGVIAQTDPDTEAIIDDVLESIDGEDTPTTEPTVEPSFGPTLSPTDELTTLISPTTQVDYRKLQQYLAAQNWRDANDETRRVLLEATNRSEQGWVPAQGLLQAPSDRGQSLKTIACWDLKTIDNLWTRYSDQHFGWSVQFPIFIAMGNRPGRLVNDNAYIDFGKSIGWYRKETQGDSEIEGLLSDINSSRTPGNNWVVFIENMTYDLSAPAGHLPRPMNQYELNGSRSEYTTLAQRLQECQVVPGSVDTPITLPPRFSIPQY